MWVGMRCDGVSLMHSLYGVSYSTCVSLVAAASASVVVGVTDVFMFFWICISSTMVIEVHWDRSQY